MKLTFKKTLLMFALIPMLVAILFLAISSIYFMNNTLEENVYTKLNACAISVERYFSLDLEKDILEIDKPSEKFIDSLEKENIELTLFKKNERWLTSIKDSRKDRVNGTECDPEIWEVVSKGQEYKTENVEIAGEKYFGYYVPVKNKGEIWGMAFAGEKTSTVIKAKNDLFLTILLISVILLVVFTFSAILTARKISSPIVKLARFNKDMANGNLDAIMDAESNIEETKDLIKASEKLKEELSDITQGIIKNMRQLNTDMGSVDISLDDCTKSVNDIAVAVEEIAKGATEMSTSVLTTASNMEKLGIDIEKIQEKVKEAKTNADIVNKVSNEAKDSLNDLMQANKNTVKSSDLVVESINESNKAVEDINMAIDIITSIASQTNLLSLNASIEAARAGASGKGFAVVAGEIKTLAEQSNTSAKEIKEIINNLKDKFSISTDLITEIKESVNKEGKVLEEVHNSFDKVKSGIDTTSDDIDSVYTTTDEVTELKKDVLVAVESLSAISEENAASCEETTATLDMINNTVSDVSLSVKGTLGVAEDLTGKIEYFK